MDREELEVRRKDGYCSLHGDEEKHENYNYQKDDNRQSALPPVFSMCVITGAGCCRYSALNIEPVKRNSSLE
jgi:hypothetical protein